MKRLILALMLVALTVAGLVLPNSTAQAASKYVSLNSIGDKYVNVSVTVKGYLSNTGYKRNKTVVLQIRKAPGKWRKVATKQRQGDGAYTFAVSFAKPRTVVLRTKVWKSGRLVGTSNAVRFNVLARPVPPPPTCENSPSPTTCPQPAQEAQARDVTTVDCSTDSATMQPQRRTRDYVWDESSESWQPGPWSAWANSGDPYVREATEAECPTEPPTPLLPDLRIRSLDKCSQADRDLSTDNSCFRIVYPGPGELFEGRKLLKFSVATMNIGDGPAHIEAYRSTPESSDWGARQIVTMSDGSTQDLEIFGADFYYAGDGHDHWHIRDFDDYQILDESGTQLQVGEKHGYCIEDNTHYTPLRGKPGVPDTPVYKTGESCAAGLQGTTQIIYGMSRGWGDTYPTTLPDQAIDVTGLPDGTYTVRVRADAGDYVEEVNEGNNAATVVVAIAGDTVTVLSSSGGI